MSLRDVTRTAQDLELTQMNGAKNKLDAEKSREREKRRENQIYSQTIYIAFYNCS